MIMKKGDSYLHWIYIFVRFNSSSTTSCRTLALMVFVFFFCDQRSHTIKDHKSYSSTASSITTIFICSITSLHKKSNSSEFKILFDVNGSLYLIYSNLPRYIYLMHSLKFAKRLIHEQKRGIQSLNVENSPHDENRSSGPRPVKLCSDQ